MAETLVVDACIFTCTQHPQEMSNIARYMDDNFKSKQVCSSVLLQVREALPASSTLNFAKSLEAVQDEI
jgi:hypothetical protein